MCFFFCVLLPDLLCFIVCVMCDKVLLLFLLGGYALFLFFNDNLVRFVVLSCVLSWRFCLFCVSSRCCNLKVFCQKCWTENPVFRLQLGIEKLRAFLIVSCCYCMCVFVFFVCVCVCMFAVKVVALLCFCCGVCSCFVCVCL